MSIFKGRLKVNRVPDYRHKKSLTTYLVYRVL